MQFDKLVSGLIGVHAFTVLGPQVLVLQKMLAAVWPKGMSCSVPLLSVVLFLPTRTDAVHLLQMTWVLRSCSQHSIGVEGTMALLRLTGSAQMLTNISYSRHKQLKPVWSERIEIIPN